MTVHTIEYEPEELGELGSARQSRLIDFLQNNPHLVQSINLLSDRRGWTLAIETRDITDAQMTVLALGLCLNTELVLAARSESAGIGGG